MNPATETPVAAPASAPPTRRDRDRELVRYVGRHGLVRIAHVMKAMEAVTYDRVAACVEAGLLERLELVRSEPGLLRATRDGLRFAGLGLPVAKVSPGGVDNLLRCATTAHLLEQHYKGARTQRARADPRRADRRAADRQRRGRTEVRGGQADDLDPGDPARLPSTSNCCGPGAAAPTGFSTALPIRSSTPPPSTADLLTILTMHECRHTFASILIDTGANPKAIQEVMDAHLAGAQWISRASIRP